MYHTLRSDSGITASVVLLSLLKGDNVKNKTGELE